MKTSIVILHGWGKTAGDYNQLREYLEKKGYTVFIPDLPGNPEQKLTKAVMNIDDYADWLKEYLDQNHIKKAIFICHSFGGRVGAKLAVKYPDKVEEFIFTGTPLIKEKLPLRKVLILYVVKVVKKYLKLSFNENRFRKLLYYLLREWDYYKAPKDIKETFKAVIAENSESYLPLIKAKTLVLWGDSDTFVPKSVGKRIAQLIPGAVYKEIPGTHRLPYERPEGFAREVLTFIM